MVSKAENNFIRFNFFTIVITFLLILAGGVVRSTGSGMGCPDWPKCFDSYIPPTNSAQLPPNYQHKYIEGRIKKNERFAGFLEKIGKQELADQIRNDKSVLEPEVFNASKTWTEYVNRLIGALTGILLIILAFKSYHYIKIAPRIFWLSVINLGITIYQGWLGSIVVTTNLTQWVVTIHMLLAVVIVSILIYTYFYSKHLNKETNIIMAKLPWLKWFLVISLILSFVQIILGTEVREAIDVVAKQLNFADRDSWIEKTGKIFFDHRNLSIFVVVINVILYKMIKDRFNGKAEPLIVCNWMLGILIVQILSGIILTYLGLPPVTQMIHILFAVLLFGMQFYLYLLVNRTKTYKPHLN